MPADLTTIRAHIVRRIDEVRATQAHHVTGTAAHFAAVAVRYELEEVLRRVDAVGKEGAK